MPASATMSGALARSAALPSARACRRQQRQQQLAARAAISGRRSTLVSRKASGAVGGSRRFACRCADEEAGGNPIVEVKEKYMELTNSIPPLFTAACVPIVALSLLCKAATGSGLPGGPFGLVGLTEGFSFLILPLGLGSLVPRVKEIVGGGDFSTQAVLDVLEKPLPLTGRGGATARVKKIDASPDSALGMQLADLEKEKARKDMMSAEDRTKEIEMNKKLGEKAVSNYKKEVTADELAASKAVSQKAVVAGEQMQVEEEAAKASKKPEKVGKEAAKAKKAEQKPAKSAQ